MKTLKKFAFVAIMMASAAVTLSSCGGGFLSNEPSLLSSTMTDPSTVMVVMRSTVKDPFNELSKNQLHALGFSVNDASTKMLYKAYRSDVLNVKDDFTKKIQDKMRTQLQMNPTLRGTRVRVDYTISVTYNNYFKRSSEKITGKVSFAGL